MEKTVVLPPMTSAISVTTAAVSPGVRLSERTASRTSRTK
jgi:hypothetical protein